MLCCTTRAPSCGQSGERRLPTPIAWFCRVRVSHGCATARGSKKMAARFNGATRGILLMIKTMNSAKLSACIITYNEAASIQARSRRSAAFLATSWIVVTRTRQMPHESSHRTRRAYRAETGRAIARACGDPAVKAAAHDWVLCVDADERASDELRRNRSRTGPRRVFATGCTGRSISNHLTTAASLLRHAKRPSRSAARAIRSRVIWGGPGTKSTRTPRLATTDWSDASWRATPCTALPFQ